MSIKHALVVDDSRSAQLALQKQLEQHDLAVALAASGEEALEFLDHETVDVIFMDHTMPGMDGLQALAAIKRNPRTAMIPVMMYTSKEGEVYVGQARALGGIGVLPKEVHPQVLFEMLLKLGLVSEKRTATEPEPGSPSRRATDEAFAPETSAEPPTGIALTAVLNRIMDDQANLRADLRRERAGLARQVAAEVIEAQRAAPDVGEAVSQSARAGRGRTLWMTLTALFALTTLILAAQAWRAAPERDAVAVPVPNASTQQIAQISQLNAALRSAQTLVKARDVQALDGLQWAINQRAGFGFDELPFDDARAAELRDLLDRLVAMDFRGRVRIESHLGEFCLMADEAGSIGLAPSDAPIEACTLIGHALDDSAVVATRQSLGFAEFLRTSPLANGSGITVELVAHDREHSLSRVPFPPDVSRAGAWNRVAERNNRLEYSLIPTGG